MEKKHKEACCLMHYVCEKCQAHEIIWNSRDGVTPFIVGCRNCNETMQHVSWEKDIPMPNMRMFIDLTDEKHRRQMREYITKIWDVKIGTGVSSLKSRYETKEDAFKDIHSSKRWCGRYSRNLKSIIII